jgi:hypothetical protein
MSSVCMKPVGGTRMRLTKVDACGVPLTGVGSCSIVSKGFVSVARTAQFADPDEFVVKNAAGEICLNERSAPSFQWYNFEITFCEVDPEIVNLLTGSPLVMDDDTVPKAVGWRTREGANVNANVALELWTRMGGQACQGGTTAYGYYVAPFIVEGYVGDLTFENGPASFVVTGARSKGAGGWGTGPFNVTNKISGTPGPSKLLAAMTDQDHDHFQMTTLAPPAVPGSCGCVTVPAP